MLLSPWQMIVVDDDIHDNDCDSDDFSSPLFYVTFLLLDLLACDYHSLYQLNSPVTAVRLYTYHSLRFPCLS